MNEEDHQSEKNQRSKLENWLFIFQLKNFDASLLSCLL